MGAAEELKAMAERRELEPTEPSVEKVRSLMCDG
jgi:hypothetical protein